MQRLNKVIVLFVCSCFLFACTAEKPTLDQLLHNKQSMTKQLESLNADLKVDVIHSEFKDNKFERVVSLKLKNNPVLIGVSEAHVSSPYFVSILKNADTLPIGKILFAKGSQVKRDKNMQIANIYSPAITDVVVKNCISKLGYDDHVIIYKRTSVFRYKNQKMQLTEYILPAINQFL